MKKMSFLKKLQLCLIFPIVYMSITVGVNLYVHYHSIDMAKKVNINIPSHEMSLIPSKHKFTLSRWYGYTSKLVIGNVSFKLWLKETGAQLRSVFMFNAHTEYYLKHYNKVYKIEKNPLFQFINDVEDSTFKSSFAPIFKVILPDDFLTTTKTYSIILFCLFFSAFLKKWQILSCYHRNDE